MDYVGTIGELAATVHFDSDFLFAFFVYGTIGVSLLRVTGYGVNKGGMSTGSITSSRGREETAQREEMEQTGGGREKFNC